MGRLIKKEKTLRNIFIRFVGFMIGFSLLIAGINVALFIYATNTEAIQPANYAESAISENRESLGSTQKVTPEMIPDVSEFGVYTLDGNYEYGSFSRETVKSIWEKYQHGESSLTGSRFLYVIPRDNSVLLISYPLSMQFNDPGLRQLFPDIEMFWLLSFVLEMILLIVILSWNFGSYLGQKISVLQSVSKNIENHNLDFDFGSSDITEINQVLDSLYHMRDGLKASLVSQWKTEKTKQDQISALAHDIKTPLTIVKGNAELLGETDLDHEQSIYQKYMLENAVQMEEYINKLVELSKLDEPQELNFEKVRVKDLIDAIHEQTKGLMVQKNIGLVWQEEDLTNAFIQADGEKLHRGIMNVIGNGVEFTPNQGTLTVMVSKKLKALVLTILDSGDGFSAQALDHGKEQFFKSDTSRTNHKHHGMGLYIADSIIKQHGGQCVLGNGEHGGSVSVTLPLL
ncbi:HAMP domain-containing sensor histidine kinase [Acetobacterium sp.]|uniref:sensor histidine kinase n=1 Tax=Acetobacterium sp. TaxID=1872094 RepID=UPI002F3FCA58